MADNDQTDNLADIAAGPAQVTHDGVSVTAQDPLKVIEVDKYLAGKSAGTNKFRGLRFTKLQNPGPLGNQHQGGCP